MRSFEFSTSTFTAKLLLLTPILLPLTSSALPFRPSQELCSALISGREVNKSESPFKEIVRALLEEMNHPRIKLIWGNDQIGKAKHLRSSVQASYRFDTEEISDPAIPQIPIPKPLGETDHEKSKPSILVLTQSIEEEDLASIPGWVEFELMQSPTTQKGLFTWLLAEAHPKSYSDPHFDLRQRQFVLNTLVALSAAPYANFVAFKHRLERVSREDHKDPFNYVVANKMAKRSDREALKDVYPDQEALAALGSPNLRLDKLSLKFYGDDRKPLEGADLIKARVLEVYYLFSATSGLNSPLKSASH